MERKTDSTITLPCLDCRPGCSLLEDLTFVWNNASEPAADDTDFVQLVNTLIATLARLV